MAKKKETSAPESAFPENPPRHILAEEYHKLWTEFQRQSEDLQLIMALSDRYFRKLKDAKDLIQKQKSENEALLEENVSLQKHLMSGIVRHPEAFMEIITHDKKMIAIFQYLEALAPSAEPILVTGETGTGKELIARAIHNLSRPRENFVAVNVASLEDQMFADALFGHLKGAYTDARLPRHGLIEEAGAGTLFLDEIGDLSAASQVKLLRLLQEREYFPLGSDQSKISRARILCSTNKNLEQCVKRGQFREDLYYRLCVHHVHIPSLRDRREDIPLLISHFTSAAAREMRKKIPGIPLHLVRRLESYTFPGNIRELRSLVYDAVAEGEEGKLSLRPFQAILEKIKGDPSPADGVSSRGKSKEFPFPGILPTLQDMRTLLIEEALRRSEGNQAQAASLLGITRQSLNKHLKNRK